MLALVVVGVGLPLVKAVADTLHGSAYHDVLSSSVFRETLVRTIWMSGVVALLCVIVGYPIAALIQRAPAAWKPLLLMIVVVPLASGAIAQTYGWVAVFRNGGIVYSVFGWIGLGHPNLLYTKFAVVVGMTHALLPILVLSIYAALTRYDEGLTAASLSLGAGRWRTFFAVKLPVLAQHVLGPIAVAFVVSLGFIITPAILGSPDSQFVGNDILQQVATVFDLPLVEAESLLLLLVSLLVLALAGATTRWLRRR
jgi:ABC-type spermidine/putrescine transport system permease subunit I